MVSAFRNCIQSPFTFDWLCQVRGTFVTKGYFQPTWKRNMCNEFWSIWVRLHLFGHNCGPQIVMKIGRNIYPLLSAVSLFQVIEFLMKIDLVAHESRSKTIVSKEVIYFSECNIIDLFCLWLWCRRPFFFVQKKCCHTPMLFIDIECHKRCIYCICEDVWTYIMVLVSREFESWFPSDT